MIRALLTTNLEYLTQGGQSQFSCITLSDWEIHLLLKFIAASRKFFFEIWNEAKIHEFHYYDNTWFNISIFLKSMTVYKRAIFELNPLNCSHEKDCQNTAIECLMACRFFFFQLWKFEFIDWSMNSNFGY